MSPRSTNAATALTERDRDLLASLLKYRYLSTAQVQRLHFPSLQTATRRLRLLAAAGYLISFRPRASSDRLAALARLGAEAVAGRLGVPLTELGWDARREKPKDHLFLEHFLAASDFRISLTHACSKSSDVRLLGFLPEHVVERTPKGTVRKYIRDVISDATDHRHKIVHTPDGVLCLERAGTAALFFVEIDRGTETLTNPERGFLKIIRFYLSLIVSNGFQRYMADFGVTKPFNAFRVLVVTSSPERLSNIREICGRMTFEPAQAKRFVWLTTQEAVLDSAILGREWQALDPTDDRRYAIVPPRQGSGEVRSAPAGSVGS